MPEIKAKAVIWDMDGVLVDKDLERLINLSP